MDEPLFVKGGTVKGEVAIAIPPGTLAAECDRVIAKSLANILTDAANKLGVVLAAPSNKYARPLPGKNAEGKTRYEISGRVEGGALLPAFNQPQTKKRGRKER